MTAEDTTIEKIEETIDDILDCLKFKENLNKTKVIRFVKKGETYSVRHTFEDNPFGPFSMWSLTVTKGVGYYREVALYREEHDGTIKIEWSPESIIGPLEKFNISFLNERLDDLNRVKEKLRKLYPDYW